MNPYEILGVESDATDKQIKYAYRQQAQKTHPDKEGGSEEAFNEVKEAYEILKDEARRAAYDSTGSVDKRYGRLDEEVAKAVTDVFIAILNNNKCEVVDYVAKVLEHFEQACERLKKELEKIKVMIGKLELLLTKVVCNDSKTNLFGDVIDSQIRINEVRMNECNIQLMIGELAIARLKKYGFEGVDLLKKPSGFSVRQNLWIL